MAALKQGDTQRFFQRGDLPAERGLGLSQDPRRRGQGAFLGRGQKGSNLVPVKGDSLPVHRFVYIRCLNMVSVYSILVYVFRR